MAKTNDRVMEMVRREVEKKPDVKSGELYEEAKKLDRSISSLTLRQFHAQYPLQVKRAMKSGGTTTPKKATRKKATRKKAAGGARTTGRRKAAAKKKTAGRRKAAAKKRTATGKRKTTRKRTAAKKRTTARKRTVGRKATRRSGRTSSRTRRASGAAPAERGSVRAVLLEFAGEVASAENKADMISVIAGMDRWVDRVVRAAR